MLIVIRSVSSSISEFTRRLPGYQTLLVERFSTYLHAFEKAGLNISDEVILEHFDPRAVMRLAAAALLRLRGILTDTFFVQQRAGHRAR